MALSWNTIAALPRLYTYADADRRERETKPVRGDEQQRKPLGRRNQKWRHIKRKAIDRVLMLHHHPEWFVEREVLVGEKKHDRYAWAFPKEEQTT